MSTTTTHLSNDTIEAPFLAPETPQRANGQSQDQTPDEQESDQGRGPAGRYALVARSAPHPLMRTPRASPGRPLPF